MSGKGQFYMFTMLILLSAVFLSLSGRQISEGSTLKYSGIYNNYLTESNYAINHAAYAGANVSGEFADFTQDFIYYAAAKSVRFSLFYILKENSTLHIANYLNQPLTILNTGEDVQPGKTVRIPYEEQVLISLDGTEYDFNLSNYRALELKALLDVQDAR